MFRFPLPWFLSWLCVLLLSVPTSMWSSAAKAPSPNVCSLTSMSASTSQSTSVVSSIFLNPASDMKKVGVALFATRGIDFTSANYFNEYVMTFDYRLLDQVSNIPTSNPPNATFQVDSVSMRSGDWFSGPFGATMEYNSTCAYEKGLNFRVNNPNFCGIPASDTVTLYCEDRWNPSATICTGVNFTEALASPVPFGPWKLSNPNSFCPAYCLAPGHYHNSMRDYYFQFTLPLNWLYPYYFWYYLNTTIPAASFYWFGVRDDMRGLPTADPGNPFSLKGVPGCASVGCALDWQTPNSIFFSFTNGGPGYNPNRITTFSLPFWDPVEGGARTTINVPLYDGNDYHGVLLGDVTFAGTESALETAPGTANSIAFMVNAVTGSIAAATQTAFNMMFCPQLCASASANQTLNYDFNSIRGQASNLNDLTQVPGLVNSTYGFEKLLPFFPPYLANPTSLSPLIQLMLGASDSQHGLIPRLYYVTWVPISLPPVSYLYVFAAPVEEIDNAAVWSVSPLALGLIQPNIDLSVDGYQLSAQGLTYSTVQGQLVSVQQFQLMNQGILDLDFTAMAQSQGITLYEVMANGSRNAVPSNYVYTLVSGAYVTLLASVDWSQIDPSAGSYTISIEPSASTNVAGCFKTIVIPISLQFAQLLTTYSLPSEVSSLIITLIVISNVWLLACVALNVLYFNNAMVKASSPRLNLLFIFGASLYSVVSITFVLPVDSNNVICQLRVWGLTLSIAILLVPLFLKTYRIGRIYSRQLKAELRLTDGKMAQLTILACMAPLLLLIVTQSLSSERSVHERVPLPGSTSEMLDQCTQSTGFLVAAFILLIITLLFGGAQAYKVYHLQAHQMLNEAQHIMIGLMFAFCYCILFVPVQFLLDSNPLALALIRATGIQLGLWVITISIFAPKFYSLSTKRDFKFSTKPVTRTNQVQPFQRNQSQDPTQLSSPIHSGNPSTQGEQVVGSSEVHPSVNPLFTANCPS